MSFSLQKSSCVLPLSFQIWIRENINCWVVVSVDSIVFLFLKTMAPKPSGEYVLYRRLTLKVLSLKADNKIDGKLFMNSELRIYYMLIGLTVLSRLHTFRVVHRFPINLIIMVLFPLYFLQIPALWPLRRFGKIKAYREELMFKWDNFGNWLILHKLGVQWIRWKSKPTNFVTSGISFRPVSRADQAISRNWH